ncbi:MAG: hypothetical protein WCX95_01720 [Candidatus Gracilibacteria bacterium]
MSLEQFFGFDAGEGMDDKSFELFKEKMRAAAAQIAAIKKEEGKQKKKEDELLKILLDFVKNSQKKELVLLVSRALEQNLPANFILAIILLGNEEIEKEIGNYLLLQSGAFSEDNSSQDHQEKALIFFKEDETMPLKIKIELDIWMKSLLFQAEENPQKLLKTAYDVDMLESDDGGFLEKKSIKVVLIQLIAHVLKEFLDSKSFPNEYDILLEFAEFTLKGILHKAEEGINSRKLLN